MNAFQIALAVARGDKKLSELRPFAQKQVNRIFQSYGGEAAVKDFAMHKPAHTKIGHRATMFRKAMTK